MNLKNTKKDNTCVLNYVCFSFKHKKISVFCKNINKVVFVNIFTKDYANLKKLRWSL